MRILLVEDEPRAAQMLAKGLREQSVRRRRRGDGKRAVYQAAITEYDAIILDVDAADSMGSRCAAKSEAKARSCRS